MASIVHWRHRINRNLLAEPLVADVLSAERIGQACQLAGHRWRDTFWSPSITLLAFLLQVLGGDKTLRAAVANLLTQLAARGERHLPSCDPSAYCQARRRLPARVVTQLRHHVAQRMDDLITSEHTWLGRRVKVFDGSSLSMPDTPELQAAFPQPPGQAAGCGFPVVQIVALFCWTTGALIDLAVDTIRPHELTLFRRLWHHLVPGDVVLGDRAYGSYVDLARLLQRGVYGVFRLHQRRPADFRTGKRLGRDDRLVTWARPARWLPSCGISREAFEQLPAERTVRLVRITKAPKGFRSRTLVVVTTLLDPTETPAAAIRALYRDRWTVELNLRSLKIALGMDILRGRSVDVVHKEIAMHLLAYNLIRLLMWHAARRHGRDLHRLSFAGTLHRLRTAFPLLLFQCRPTDRAMLLEHLLACIASDRVPDRPNRMEPRRRKRRPKQYSLMQKPRRWYHAHGDDHAR